MKRHAVTVAAAIAGVLLSTGCATGKSQNIVDSKVNIQTPGGSTCFLLEIDKMSGAGERVRETFYCVTKEEWDANEVGKPWVNAAGRKIA